LLEIGAPWVKVAWACFFPKKGIYLHSLKKIQMMTLVLEAREYYHKACHEEISTLPVPAYP
jgi:hypothetical protein